MAWPVSEHFYVAVLAAPHGIKGEFKVKLLSDLPDRLASLSEVLLFSPDGKKPLGCRKISGLRGAGHEIIALEGITDRTEAEKYKGCLLAVPRDQAYPLEEGQYYIADLIGMRVSDKTRGVFGKLSQVLDSPAQDIMQIKRAGKKDLLLPMNKETLTDVDFENGIINVILPPGLWEVYE